ncbi:3-phosphoshikimate 1-carboxyvinyltransferase [Constantimarinum furrinae]|uniref:3-phosphoshikimate 1-carboxyvinyltransferase n=1 Tax=Constantimarinum furrinae TaxID=2562285 RepID=A0A7G8PRJ5_9FLAO|nr:3-phosphoshikimate 1-carboxyvinyltransferase [Constantimarinum furrinae]QNJ96961.1 3-phosphoshikimate 1-carboxyvinyltransferase [Constantimarinum furrinae]
MKAYLSSGTLKKQVEVQITGSKSESNRLLILQALYPNLKIENLSNSDDTTVLQNGLLNNTTTIDIGHAGTAMRFLTAYFASRKGAKITITGSKRMQERPIGVLVDALMDLGAQILYLENDGFPPLEIEGDSIVHPKVEILANTSSQYVTALLLIAPSLKHGLQIELLGDITSRSYIEMTLSLLEQIGIKTTFSENCISVFPSEGIEDQTVTVESDWSSASYFYSLVALSEELSVTLKSYRINSLQGDAVIVDIYQQLGVSTTFNPHDGSITLTASETKLPETLSLDLTNTPDIAQTIAVTCFGLGISCDLTGLHTLKIKETDRLVALKTELEKLGASVVINQDGISVRSSGEIKDSVEIETYNDHRMAMAFAPLAVKTDICIDDCEVVSKSYPGFFEDLIKVGIKAEFKR